jgi:hypothetical protein
MSNQKWNWARCPDECRELLTDRQIQFFDLLKVGERWEDIATTLNTTYHNVHGVTKKLKEKFRNHGCDSPDYQLLAPFPHRLKGISNYERLNKSTGEMEVVARWVKTDLDKAEQEQAFREFIEGLKEDIPRIKKTNVKTKDYDKDIMPAIIIGDAHVGMYAYGPETRSRDFDTDSASEEIRKAIDELVDRSPKADTALLVNVGDFLHSDTSRGETWGGTRLDNDTRRKRVLNIAGKTLRYSITRMLEKFNKVVVVNARGNHDDNSALALSVIIETAYEKEPRVNVLETEGYFHYIQYGKWLIGIHHGDKVKNQRIGGLMAKLLPKAWGETTHRMWILGHFHHKKTEEMDGVTARTFGTLAPSDSWHASMGFGSESSMELLVFRRSGGLHSELVYSIPNKVIEPDARIL